MARMTPSSLGERRRDSQKRGKGEAGGLTGLVAGGGPQQRLQGNLQTPKKMALCPLRRTGTIITVYICSGAQDPSRNSATSSISEVCPSKSAIAFFRLLKAS
jgi:hypothetical protein